jgi:hypothetical protein
VSVSERREVRPSSAERGVTPPKRESC